MRMYLYTCNYSREIKKKDLQGIYNKLLKKYSNLYIKIGIGEGDLICYKREIQLALGDNI